MTTSSDQRSTECVLQDIVCGRELKGFIGIDVAIFKSVYRKKLKHRIVGCGEALICFDLQAFFLIKTELHALCHDNKP